MNTPARLFAETITNLADNGVPNMYFETLFKTALTERVDRFLKYSLGDRADAPHLFEACAREGGVFYDRLAREAPGRARSSGYVAEDYDAPDEDDEDEDRLGRALREQSSAWWPDPVSGLPSGLAETCMVLLGAGFVPATCGVLKDKLGEVVRSAVRSFKTKYRFAVPMSCSALVVPDPFGVLGPNEIHVKCSRRDFVDQESVKTDQIVGDVLVTRHPCKVPSDVQKVKAVLHDQLRNYCDVIVVSTRSHMYKNVSLDRHLASLTGGGDYDGDTMEVFWDPQLVEPFQQPDPHVYANEPSEVQRALIKNTETVSAFLSRVPQDAPEEYQIFALQGYLLGALKGHSFVSTYSIWWEKSTYEKGYRHKDTVFLAYMFCAALDGLKTGVSVDPDVYKLHSKTWNGKDPLQWKSLGKDPPVRSLKRDHKRGEFVMDLLLRCVLRECHEQLRRIDEWIPADRVFFGKWGARDEDLARPWLMALKDADTLRKSGHTAKWDALQRIQAHVEEVYPKFQEKFGRSAAGSFTSLPIEERQDVLRAESRMFHSQPTELLALDDPTTIKASCMYVHAYEQGGRGRSRIPWDVAAGTLCETKAKARGSPQVFASDMGPWMELNKAFLRHTHKMARDAQK
ncbi:RNA dependent RNA polymerase-domain-containing protein [Trametes meyenii]|nr:RNA dependent RNA polymerase-domain-containing protein [Trametes meyenii]